jgi:hypothetical protein
MTVKEKRRIIEKYLIQILRRQYGGNDAIHKIDINEKNN